MMAVIRVASLILVVGRMVGSWFGAGAWFLVGLVLGTEM